MRTSAGGVELIVAANRDPVFCIVVLIGAGDIIAEVLADRMFERPPPNEHQL